MGQNVGFQDLFRPDFMQRMTQDVTLAQIAIGLGLSFLIGLFIYLVYKRAFRGVLYSRSFNVSLIAVTMITTLVLMAVTSNIILSLGMVGALSIVRFRTAIKDPMDIVFMFWAIGAGIITGAGFYPLAILGSLVIGLVLFLSSRLATGADPYLLVVRCDGDASEGQVLERLRAAVRRFSLRSKTVTPGEIEVTYELRVPPQAGGFVSELVRIPGVASAVLISYNGDYVS